MSVPARMLAALALAGTTLVTFVPPASATMPSSACAGKGVCCASNVKQNDDAQGNEDDQGDHPVSTECPPPMIPEVPTTVLLPLSAAAVAGVVVVGARRRTKTRTPPA